MLVPPRRLLPLAVTLFTLGSSGSALASTNNIYTVVNASGLTSFGGDGSAALSAGLPAPASLAVMADGSYLVGSGTDARIRKVAADGTITTVAGTGTPGQTGNGGPATSANIGSIQSGIAVLPDGSFVFGDGTTVRRVASGTITRVAGGNPATPGNGDGGPATSAHLGQITDISSTRDGGYLIADTDNNVIRKVDPNGTITTVAGNGVMASSGDGSPATQAGVDRPQCVASLPGGGYLICEYYDYRIRFVDGAGVIHTSAGTGTAGPSGDGGPAVRARIDSPAGITPVADGGYVFSESSRVRRVDPTGRITTIAGNGTASYGGDGKAATEAMIFFPTGLGAVPSGGVLIADRGNNRVRYVDNDLRPGPAGTAGPAGATGANGANGANGASGAQGAQGPAGKSGVVTVRDRLTVLLGSDRYSVRKGKKLTIRYVATAAARVTLEVRTSRNKLVTRATSTSKRGRNAISVTVKSTGTFRLTFSARSSDGQKASDKAALAVRR